LDRTGPSTSATSAKPAPVAPDTSVEAKPADALNASGKPQRAPEAAPPAGATVSGTIAANPEPPKPAASASKAEAGDTRPNALSPARGFVVQLAAFPDAKASPVLSFKP